MASKKLDIDRSLRKIIHSLNDFGLKTKFSCEGHREGGDVEGYIVFKKKLDSSELQLVKDILHTNGILRVRSRTKSMRHGKVTVVYFAPRSWRV